MNKPEPIDPDFKRLMEGDVKLSDLPEETQARFAVWVHGRKIGIQDIRDPVTRGMMEKWNDIF